MSSLTRRAVCGGVEPHFRRYSVARVGWLLCGWSTVLLGLTIGIACEEGPPLRGQGVYVDYHAEMSREVCAGTITGIDRILQNLAYHGQIELSARDRFRYILVGNLYTEQEDNNSEIVDRCANKAGSCFRWQRERTEIYTANPLNIHELAHAAEFFATGSLSLPFFSEAFAQSIDPRRSFPEYWALSASEIRAGIVHSKKVNHDFLVDQIGTAFASFLISTRGLAQYWRLATRLSQGGSLSYREIDDAAITVYGESLESLLTERFKQVNSLVLDESPHLHVPIAYCGPFTPMYTLGIERLMLPRLESCADSWAQGILDEDGQLRVETSLVVEISARAGDPPFVEDDRSTWPARLIYRPSTSPSIATRSYNISSCQGYVARDPGRPRTTNKDGWVVVALAPGTYFVWVQGMGTVTAALPEPAFIERTSQSTLELSE